MPGIALVKSFDGCSQFVTSIVCLAKIFIKKHLKVSPCNIVLMVVRNLTAKIVNFIDDNL